MTMLSVCWLTASAFSSSCRLICRSYSFQNSTVKEATPNSSMMSIVLPRITWFARRAASLFLLGLSVMPVLLSERRGRFPRPIRNTKARSKGKGPRYLALPPTVPLSL